MGRLVSFGFLVACIVPIHSTIKKLGLSANVLPAFIAITFSSPIYLYWGRAS